MLEVILDSRAQRELESIPALIQERMAEALRRLASDPLAGKPLKGAYRGLRSLRLGDFRAVYRVQADRGRVLVGHIGNRRDVYR